MKSLLQDLYEHAKHRIPGGTQLLSKRPEQFAPGQWPNYFTMAHTPEIMEKYYVAIDEVFAEMKAVLDKDSLDAILDAIGGPVCQSGFKRLLK